MDFSFGSERKADVSPRVKRSLVTVTTALIAINVLVFAAMTASGVSFLNPTPREVIPWGADFGPLTIAGAQWWRMLTACFVHFGIIHIGFNMFVLYQIGPFIETVFGRARYLLLYFFAGLAASIVSLLVHPLTTSAGASGAIFGLYGAVFGFLLMERRSLAPGAVQSIGKSAGIFILYNFIYGGMNGRTDLAAHIGGLIAGFVAGALLVRRRAGGPWRVPVPASVIVLAGILGAGAIALAQRPENRSPENALMATVITSRSLSFGNEGQLLYRDGITEADAKKLAAAINQTELAQVKGALLTLSRPAGRTTLSLVLGDGKSNDKTDANNQSPQTDLWNDPDAIKAFTDIGHQLAPAVGGPFDLVLLDGDGVPRRTVNISGM